MSGELKVIYEELTERQAIFKELLPPDMSPQRFCLIAYSHIRKNPTILKCHPMDIIAEVSKSAELGLDFSIPNEVSLVPFKDRRSNTHKVQAIMGYKGYAKLARQAPGVKSLTYQPVYENDEFALSFGSDAGIRHSMKNGENRGPVTGFYAMAQSRSGGVYGPEFMAWEEVVSHAKRYLRFDTPPFGDVKSKGREAEHFVVYGLKTILMRLCKRHLDLSSKGIPLMENDFTEPDVETAEPTEPKTDINQLFGILGEPNDSVPTDPGKDEV